MLKALAYAIWQLIWGFPQTLAGACVCAACAARPHFRYHGAIVTVWSLFAGLSLGPFIFINAWPGEFDEQRCIEPLPGVFVDERLLVHEYGHTVQSLVLGPAYLLVIGLPSLAWMKAPRLARKRREAGMSYYSFYTERWANSLGERVLGRPSMGFARID